MQATRIAELLEPFLLPISSSCHSAPGQKPGEEPAIPAVLSLSQLQSVSIYIDLLLRWNARINLTSIRDEEEIVTRHFGESFFAASHLFPGKKREEDEHNLVAHSTAADLGSGAGFPGIPIKLWAADIALTLIESNHKKATFLREVARSLTLTDINIRNTRAEDMVQTFDLVTLRAVERFKDILPVAARLLAPSGRLALLISHSQVEDARSLLAQLNWQPPLPIPQSDLRILFVGTRDIESKQVGS